MMFPLPIGFYVKVILGALVVFGAWYNGYRIGVDKLTTYKLEQEAVARKVEAQHQAEADQIRNQKDAQIKTINTQLATALSELRNRPNRPSSPTESPSNGQAPTGCTGATLFAEDSEFLEREASRADQIRVALQACYAQYDEVTK